MYDSGLPVAFSIAFEQAFIISIFLSPRSTLVVKINEGSPGRSHILVSGPGTEAAMFAKGVVGLLFLFDFCLDS